VEQQAQPVTWRAILLFAIGAACTLPFALLPGEAHAYCRTSTCKDCPRDEETGCTLGGRPISWPEACVSYSLNERAASSVDLETATALAEEAFNTWQTARCPPDGAHPSIHLAHSFGPVMCEEVEYNASSGNANIIVFREGEWPYDSEGLGLASTSLTATNDGDIVDADIEINATLPLSISEQRTKGIVPGAHDLLSILTHESGHFLGLDHSRVPEAVMAVALAAGEVRVELSDDDVAAICEAYPPERTLSACNDAPHGGFATTCNLPSRSPSGCSIAGLPSTSGSYAFGVAIISLLAMTRQIRRRTRAAR